MSRFFSSSKYETAGWLLFGAVGCVLGWVFTHQLDVHERPIPVQLLDNNNNNNNYVRDLSFDLLRPEKDAVSTILTYILAGLIPILFEMALAYKFGPLTDIVDILTVYLVTFGTSLLAVEPVKWYVSWLRPNFYEMCEPNEDYTLCESDEPSGEARHSFPSGHAVTAWSGLTLLTYYIHFRFGVAAYRRKLQKARSTKTTTEASVLDSQREPEDEEDNVAKTPSDDKHNNVVQLNRRVLNKHRIISMIGLIIPQGLALFIGASRIRDNRHFPADVVAGALLGTGTALFVAPLWWFDEADE